MFLTSVGKKLQSYGRGNLDELHAYVTNTISAYASLTA
jgi:hypothetical protein